MPSVRRHLADTYLSIDTRSLAAFRIALASALGLDLALRARVLDAFYTNAGLLPNHSLLWSPWGERMYSLFFGASRPLEAAALMAGCAFVYLLLLAGAYTRLAQVLAFVAVVSLNTRIAPLENGGNIVLILLSMWSLFLPLGERFSIDAVRASLRRPTPPSPGGLNQRDAFRTPPRRAYSLAAGALLFQLAAIYALNALHKDGPTWVSGDAVHYVLHQDPIVRWPGVWLREHAPVAVLRALSWTTIALEALTAVLVLSPIATRFTRPAAIALMLVMHLGFEACIDVGVFSFAMLAFCPLLVAPQHWQALRGWALRWHRPRRVFVDDDCGFCMMCGRLLARLDALQRLEFASNADADRLPREVDLDMAHESITTVELETGRITRGAAAVAALLRSIPFGFVFALPLQARGLRRLADRVYQRIARERLAISVWLGYGACGLPLPAAAGYAPADSTSEARRLAARLKRIAAESCVAILLLAALSQLVRSNGAFPAALRHEPPALFRALIEYPRAFQTWYMFAPDAPMRDDMIEVDARTADGRRVDPFNQVASRVAGPGLQAIPPRLDHDSFFGAYSLFVWQPQFEPYRAAFRNWILRYPERTGRPGDAIERFTVYVLSDRSPQPGSTQPTDFTRRAVLFYP